MKELKRKQSILICLYVLVILFLLVPFFIRGNSWIASLIIFLQIPAALLLLLAARALKARYRADYKKLAVPQSLKSIFSEYRYEPKAGLPVETLAESGAVNRLLEQSDRIRTEDYIQARYHNIAFQQSDVSIDVKRHVRHNTPYFSILEGRWMVLDLNREFREKIQIIGIDFFQDKDNRILQMHAVSTRGLFEDEHQYFSLETGDELFEKRFRVFAFNDREARELLTPDFRTHLMNVAARIDGKVMFCFAGKKLHVVINDRKNTFEPGKVFQLTDTNTVMQNIRSEIRTSTRIIDELSMDNDLFQPEE